MTIDAEPEAPPSGRVPWGRVAVFVGIALTAGWIVCLPLWLSPGGLENVDPLLDRGVRFAMATTPALAAIVVVLLLERRSRPARALGLLLRPAPRTLAYCAIAWFGAPLLLGAGLLLAGALGLVALDFSGEAFRARFLADIAGAGVPSSVADMIADLPGGVLILAVLAQAATGGVLMGAIAGLGEEVGWRGWLLPALLPLGTWPAIALSSAVWALWHAPLVLLGSPFPQRGPLGLLLMLGFCLALGALLSWLRFRAVSIVPAAIALGSTTAFAGALSVLFIATDADGGGAESATAGDIVRGPATWIVLLAVVGVLAVARQFRPREIVRDD